MAVPKRKSSKQKIRQRKASHKKSLPAVSVCPECGEPKQPHRPCTGGRRSEDSCGTYRGRQILTNEVD